jgi:hypothetical protein
MKKGVGPIVSGLLIMTIIVVGAIVGISTLTSQERLSKKHLLESTLISESDEVETYARSFQNSVEMAIVQAIYSSGAGVAVLEEDFDSVYSKENIIPYWQIYDDIYIPENLESTEDEMGFEEKMGNLLLRTSQAFMINYFDAFSEFIDSNNIEIDFFIVESETGIPKMIEYDFTEEDKLTLTGSEVTFLKKLSVEDRVIEIDNTFWIQAQIDTKFVKLIRKSHQAVFGAENLEGCVAETEERGEVEVCLNELAEKLEGPQEDGIIVTFELLDGEEGYKYDPVSKKRYATIKAELKECLPKSIPPEDTDCTENDHLVYDFLKCEDEIDMKNFAIKFFVRVGDLIQFDSDHIVVKGIDIEDGPKFEDCGKGLGIISCNDVCNFLPGEPLDLKGCKEEELLGPPVPSIKSYPSYPTEGIQLENPGMTCGPLCQETTEEADAKKDDCEFSLKTKDNNLTEYFCIGQAASVEGENKYNCEKYCRDIYGITYTSYCLETCSDDIFSTELEEDIVTNIKGGFCFCKNCELSFVKMETIDDDCFLGASPYCEHGNEINIEASYSGIDCPSQSEGQTEEEKEKFLFELHINSWNNTGGSYGKDDRCTLCDFNYKDERTTCSPNCDENGNCEEDCDMQEITVECTNQLCQAEWEIPEIPAKCWGRNIFLNTSFLTHTFDKIDELDETPLIYGYTLANDDDALPVSKFRFAQCIDTDRDPTKDTSEEGICICVSIDGTCEDNGWKSCSGCDKTKACMAEGGNNKRCCKLSGTGDIYGDSPWEGGKATQRTGDPNEGYSLNYGDEDYGIDYCIVDETKNFGKETILKEFLCVGDEAKIKTYDCNEMCRPKNIDCPDDKIYGECWNTDWTEGGGYDESSGNPGFCQCVCEIPDTKSIICHSDCPSGDETGNGCEELKWVGNGQPCICPEGTVCYPLSGECSPKETGICRPVDSDINLDTDLEGQYAWRDTIEWFYTVQNTGDIKWTFLDEVAIEKVAKSENYVIEEDGYYPYNWDTLIPGQSVSHTLEYEIQCGDPVSYMNETGTYRKPKNNKWYSKLQSYTDRINQTGIYIGGWKLDSWPSEFKIVQCDENEDCQECLNGDYVCDTEYGKDSGDEGDCCHPKELDTPDVQPNRQYCDEPFTIKCPSADCSDCIELDTGTSKVICDPPKTQILGDVCYKTYNCSAPAPNADGDYTAICTAQNFKIEDYEDDDCCLEDTTQDYEIIGESEEWETSISRCLDNVDNDCDASKDEKDSDCYCRTPCDNDFGSRSGRFCLGEGEICNPGYGDDDNICHECDYMGRQLNCGEGEDKCELECDKLTEIDVDFQCDEKSNNDRWCIDSNTKMASCSSCTYSTTTCYVDCYSGSCRDCDDFTSDNCPAGKCVWCPRCDGVYKRSGGAECERTDTGCGNYNSCEKDCGAECEPSTAIWDCDSGKCNDNCECVPETTTTTVCDCDVEMEGCRGDCIWETCWDCTPNGCGKDGTCDRVFDDSCGTCLID